MLNVHREICELKCAAQPRLIADLHGRSFHSPDSFGTFLEVLLGNFSLLPDKSVQFGSLQFDPIPIGAAQTLKCVAQIRFVGVGQFPCRQGVDCHFGFRQACKYIVPAVVDACHDR